MKISFAEKKKKWPGVQLC